MDLDIKQFQPVFIEECREGLDIMETELLKLTAGELDVEAVNTIFRVAHSIKGGAGTFGFTLLTEFTHVAETLLDDIRASKIVLCDDHITLLLKSGDCLREWIERLAEDNEIPPDDAVILKQAFEQFLSVDSAVEAADSAAEVVDVVTSCGSEMAGWRIEFVPGQDILKQGNEPWLIFAELAELGDLTITPDLSGIPKFEELDPQTLYIRWHLELLGHIDKSLITEAFEWVEDESDITILAMTETLIRSDEVPASSTAALKPEAHDTNSDKAIAIAPVKSTKDSAPKPVKTAESSSIRVSIDKVDSLINMVGELVITQAMLGEIGENFTIDKLSELRKGLMQLSQHTREMQDSVMKIRMLPIQFAFNRIPRMVRDLSNQLGKNVELRVVGEETELDKIMLEKLSDPIIHLVRNALDHGIETIEERALTDKSDMAYLDIKAYHQGGKIVVEIGDDGRGLNRAKIKAKAIEKGVISESATLTNEQIDELIFAPGFSTVETISDISGRGVGMDVVKRNIEALGGDISVRSVDGVGSCFSIRLPLTLSIMDGQLFNVGNKTYILPIMSIIESLQLQESMVTRLADGTEIFKLRDEFIPIIRLCEVLNHCASQTKIADGLFVVVENGSGKFGLFVDDLLAQQQVVIKSLEENFMKVDCISGATILGNGTVALILDIADIVKSNRNKKHAPTAKSVVVAA